MTRPGDGAHKNATGPWQGAGHSAPPEEVNAVDRVTETATERRLLTVEQAATRLGCTRRKVELMIHNHTIVCHQTGERYGYRIPSSEVERLLAERAGAQGQAAPSTGWPAQARVLRNDAVRVHLEAMRNAVKDVIQHADAVEKLLAAEEGDAR